MTLPTQHETAAIHTNGIAGQPQINKSPAEPLAVLEPSHGWALPDLRTLWHYRELLYFLVWRDIKVRYKQTALGVAWAILQPFLTMVVFSIFLGRLGGLPSEGLPYPIFTYTALLPWQLFANSMAAAANSLIMNQHLITKVYFPRLLVPLAPVLVGLIDFALAFVVLLGMMAYYGIYPTLAILTLPLWLVMAIATALAAGLWLSALNVQYRDVQYTIPFLTQFWLFATPVAYSITLVPLEWRGWYAINPMVGVVEGFRWALLGSSGAPVGALLVSVLVVGVLLFGGLFYFRKMEKSFADIV
ncbi:MAG: phosphate ABC transporter permease [Chloroflexi bacterium]|nr:MAG: phosphate ABC transporter permease [Chloroflexota bacterium]